VARGKIENFTPELTERFERHDSTITAAISRGKCCKNFEPSRPVEAAGTEGPKAHVH